MHILVKPIEVRVKCLEGDGLFAETFQIDGDKCHLEEEKSREAIRRMFMQHFAEKWRLPVVLVEFETDAKF